MPPIPALPPPLCGGYVSSSDNVHFEIEEY